MPLPLAPTAASPTATPLPQRRHRSALPTPFFCKACTLSRLLRNNSSVSCVCAICSFNSNTPKYNSSTRASRAYRSTSVERPASASSASATRRSARLFPPSQIVWFRSAAALYCPFFNPGKSTPCCSSIRFNGSGKSGTSVCHVAWADRENCGR